MKNDGLTQRIYVLGTLETASPLIIGSGEDDTADIQMMRGWGDEDGTPFIPGSAIAGATQHFLKECLPSQKQAIDLLYGEKADLNNSKKETTQSLITFYDLFPIGKIDHLPMRDGVRLEYDTKTAADTAKYDYEIVERKQQFEFKLEVAFRQHHQEQQGQMRTLLKDLCAAIMKQQVTLGAKTRRGFGEVCLKEAKMLTLNMPQDAQTWIDFQWNDEYFQKHHAEVIAPKILPAMNRTDLSVTFQIPYSILIRHESGDPSTPDTTHLTTTYAVDGEPKTFSIIPGTSWNGALRHAIHALLHDMGKGEKSDVIIKGLFGDVDEQAKKAKASRVIMKESLIEGGQRLTYTRNKVDRFTGGVVDSALFDEQPHYGGSVKLEISIKDAKDWEKGLLLLALKDIGNGIQPIGGEANIGRGILANPNIQTTIDEPECLKALAKKLQEV